MITDKDFSIDKTTWLLIAGALAYAVMLMDVVPDFIPSVGFVDDVFVISAVMKKVSGETDRYKQHLSQR